MYELYQGLSIALMIIMVLFSIGMIIAVMMQKGNEGNNIGAISGGADSFFGKNKSHSVENKLKRITIYIAIGILLSSILFFIVQILKDKLGQ